MPLRTMTRLSWICLSLFAGAFVTAVVLPVQGQPNKDDELASNAQEILMRHCYKCHGDPKQDLRGKKLNLFDPRSYLDEKRKIVIPKNPDGSKLVLRIENDEKPMPPEGHDRLSRDEIKLLRGWITAGAPLPGKTTAKENTPPKDDTPSAEKTTKVTTTPPADQPPAGVPTEPAKLAKEVRKIFKQQCLECHGGAKTKAGLKILELPSLLEEGRVVRGKPAESKVVKAITSTDEAERMPQGKDRKPLTAAEQDLVKAWIIAGAPEFPVSKPISRDKVGEDYILKAILQDVRKLKTAEQSVEFVRYFSLNHLATTLEEDDLDESRKTLTLMINHLSLLRDFARCEPIEDTKTIYRLDLTKVGWNKTPYPNRKDLNLYDLALLEYPYSVARLDSPLFRAVMTELLTETHQVRPVPYVRGDWFVSRVMQPPIYEDFLQLPFELKKLEERLGVTSEDNVKNGIAKRGGVSVSGVSRNNRVVEWHPSTVAGSFWKSFDFLTSENERRENMFQNPIDLKPTGGEMIFTLKNGLQGYFVCDSKGNRLEEAPTGIVTDPFSSNQTVRNGLSCIRCHSEGMKRFTDVVRPALQALRSNPANFDRGQALKLYAEQKEMDKLLDQDGTTFLAKLRDLFNEKTNETTGRVAVAPTQRYLDAPLTMAQVSAELNQPAAQLEGVFTGRSLSALGLNQLSAPNGTVRRDTWEGSFDQVVRSLGAGEPIVPLDGVSRLPDYRVENAPFEVVTTINERQKGNHDSQVEVLFINLAKHAVFAPNDEFKIAVVNNTGRPVFLEVTINSFQGLKAIWEPGLVQIDARKSAVFPQEQAKVFRIKPTKGKEQFIILASDTRFPAGERLHGDDEAAKRGEVVGDRILHNFYEMDQANGQLRMKFDASRMVKKTFEIETK
jgi:mono/diheme cytochrome c family protein